MKWQFLLLAIVLGIMLIIVGYVYYRYEERTIRNEKYNELKVIADLKISQITEWRDERLADVQVFAESPFIRQNVLRWLLSKDNTIKTDLLKRISLIKYHYRYENVFIVSPEGKLLLSLDIILKNIDSITIGYCKNSVKEKKIIFSDFYLCPTNKTIHLDILEPISNEENVPIAVLILRVNPYDYLYKLITYWPTPSKTAEVLIVRKDGDSILYMNELRHFSNTALKLRISLSNTKIPAVEAVLGCVGIIEGTDYRGIKVLADVRPVPDTPWFMVAKVDKREILSELYYRTVIIIVLIIGSLLFLCFGLVWFYRSRQKNIYKQLLVTGNALQESQEGFKTTLYCIGDAVITTDMNGLVRNMNPVAEQLTGWNESEAKGTALEKIFQIVNEETRNKVENPVHKILREGLVVGLANHTLLISKDGREMPIADSGAPIKNSNNKIMGIVLVFRDQTTERMAEKALRASERKFRDTVKHLDEGFYSCTMDGILLEHNMAFNKMLGFDINKDLKNSKLPDFWQNPDDRKEYVNELMTRGVVRNFLINAKKIGGEKIAVMANAHLIKDEKERPVRIEGTFTDITERKRAEETLMENERKLREVQEMAHLGFWSWDIKTGNVEWSDEVFKIFCLDPKAFTPQIDSILELSPWPEDHQRDKELINRAIETHSPGFYEQKFLRPDQSIGYYYSTFQGNYDEKGDLISIVGTVLDITERKRAEDALLESEDKFKYIFDNSSIGKSITLPTGEINVNQAFCNLLGYTKEELQNKKWQDISHPDDLELTQREIDKLISGETIKIRFNKRYIHKNGSIVWVDISSSIRRNAEGKPLYFITSLIDITERKRAEQVLRESEARFSTVFQASPVGMSITNIADGQYIDVNEAFLNLFGYTREEALSHTSLQLQTWATPEERDKIVNILSEQGRVRNIEALYRRKSGEIWTALVSAEVVEVAGKRYILALLQDITERKQSEQALKTSESFLNNIINQSPYPMWISDNRGTLIRINQACLDLLHISEEEVLGKYNILTDNIVEEQGFMPLVKSVFKKGETVKFELRYDSSQLKHLQLAHFKFLILSVTVFAIRDSKGIISNAVIQHIDITEQKRAEEEIHKLNAELEMRVQQRTADLTESEERFRQLAEASCEAIVIHEGGILLRANDQYFNLFGFKPEEMLGKQVMPLTTAPQSLEVLRKQIAAGGIGPYTATGQRKDGTTFPMEVRARNIEYKGRTVRVAAILDISLRMQVEMELRERTAALEIVNKELEAFSYSVSHDLRAPLRHTSGYVELLSNRFKEALSEKGRHYLDAIADSIHQMGTLIDDLLQFSRTGRLEMCESALDMNLIVEEVSKQLHQDNPKYNIKWVIGTLPSAIGDDAMMRLVWINLLSNAVKFTRTRKKAIIEIGANDEGTETIFFVRDNGVGFDMQYAQKLFGVFQRMHPMEEFEGTGIGLANVQRIISRHGGRTWAEAEVDKGATFYFSLPKRQ